MLYGPLTDQTVLHNILERIRDMNLQLISVNKVDAHLKDQSQTTTEGGEHSNWNRICNEFIQYQHIIEKEQEDV